MNVFATSIAILLDHEGDGFIEDDHGRGPSKWGVTLKTAREFFPNWTAAEIRSLTRQEASDFYWYAFWQRYRLGLLDDSRLATKMLDLAVNLGGGTAVRLLQRAVGAKIDGVLGPETAELANRDPFEALVCLRHEAAEHYRAIVARDPTQAPNLAGWLTRLKT